MLERKGAKVGLLTTACIIGAIANAMPERLPASGAVDQHLLLRGGTHSDGSRYVGGDVLVGGAGACPGHGGVDSIETDVTNVINMPVEALEGEATLTHRSEHQSFAVAVDIRNRKVSPEKAKETYGTAG